MLFLCFLWKKRASQAPLAESSNGPLTGFETYTATSRSCAILPQIRGELRIIYKG